MLTWWVGAVLGAGAGAAAAVAVAALRRRYLVVTVDGPSMIPTYRHGDRVLVRRGAGPPPRRGEVVVLRPPPMAAEREVPPPPAARAGGEWNIKRVVAAPGDPLPEAASAACGQPPDGPVPAGHFVVFGDGPASYDSRAWGFLPADHLVGVVLRRLSATQ